LLSTLTILKRLLAYTRRYWWQIAIGTVGIIASQILAITIPQILRFVIDRGVTLGDRDYMLHAGLLVVGLGVLRGLTGFLSRYFAEAQSHRIAYDIRNALYDKVQRLPFRYHDNARTGSLITRGISDVDEVQRFLAYGILDGLNTVLLALFAVSMMFYINPLLALAAALPLLPLAYASVWFAAFVEREWRVVMEKLSALGDHLQENLVGAEVVRAFAREPHEIARFGIQNEELYHQHLKVVRTWSNYIPFSAVMTALSIVITLIFGGWLEQRGSSGVTLGVIVQFNAYILLMAQPIRFFGFVIMLINAGIASARRVFEVLDEPEVLQDAPNALDLPPVRGVVCFEDVSFDYGAGAVLHNINLRAEPDHIIAVIGKTGAGKSTLINLIPRFYEVSSGKITIDGYDIKTVTLKSLRQQIGIVLQETLLFSATIRENIALGNPHASEEAIIAAAQAANAHGFITEFPNGYATLVGERGVTLSGGQRQRIAIARALLIDPRILILDDATSSVDTQTEHIIQEALQRLMRGRTTFVVAQRLSTVLNATEILVVDGGRIMERGTHAHLLQTGKLYQEIYELQLADQERVRRETLHYDAGFFRQAGD